MQEYYLRSRANFKVKAAVTADPLVIITDDRKIHGPFTDGRENNFNPKPLVWIKPYYYIFRMQRLFYTCFYFYFMHFLTITVPIYSLVFTGEESRISGTTTFGQ